MPLPRRERAGWRRVGAGGPVRHLARQLNPPLAPSRWITLLILACAGFVLACSSAGARPAGDGQGGQDGVPFARLAADRSFRRLCAHQPRIGGYASLAQSCPSMFEWPLPRHPRLLDGSAAASRAVVARILGMGYGGVRPIQLNPVPGDDYGHPVFYASRRDPLYRVHCDRPGRCPIEGWTIRIPPQARPASGADAHMAVIDPASGREYDFYQVQSVPLSPGGGRIVASWAGWAPLNGWGAGSSASCADAACTPLTGGLITYSELASGHIDHALFIVVGCTNGARVYPAAETSGTCDDPRDAPALGQWLQLAMSDRQIDRLRVSRWQKAIFRAFAHYGAMIGDAGSTGGFDFMVESPMSWASFGRSNPFLAWAAGQRRSRGTRVGAYAAAGTTHYTLDLNDALPWGAKLRVVDPCVIDGRC